MLLKDKIKKAHRVIKKAAERWKPKEIVVAWTGGKDSTVLLHLIKEVFSKPPRLKRNHLSQVSKPPRLKRNEATGKPRGLKRASGIPFRVMFNDSTLEFPEVYDFVKKLKKDWDLDLLWVKHLPEDLKAYRNLMGNKADEPPRLKRNEATGKPRRLNESEMNKLKEEAMEIMRIAKINAINYAIAEYKIEAFMSGIRWDEHESRSKEKYFSPRSTHMRIHPILHFTEDDIWRYIHLYNVPYSSLYDSGYRSLGERPFTGKSKKGKGERSGRERDKEIIMRRLRSLGYW